MIPARQSILRSIPAPSFSRDFAATKSLNNGVGPAISFSRASNATYFDGTGTLQYAPNNLLLQSQALSTTWTQTNITSTNNSSTAPDGTTTATNLVPNTTSSVSHLVLQQVTVFTGTCTFSVYIKPNGYNYVWVSVWSASSFTGGFDGGSQRGILINLTNGSTITSDIGNGLSAGSATSVGNGWYRVQITSTSIVTGAIHGRIYPRSTGSFIGTIPSGAFAGDGTSGVLAWGAQLEQGASTASTYFPTTTSAYYGPRFDSDPVTLQSKGLLIEEARTNLHCYSNDLTKSTAWNSNNITTAASGTGIDGLTANRITENAVASSNHYIIAYGGNATANAVSYTSGTAYTFSAYLKKGIGSAAPDWVQLALSSGAFGGGYANFNLTTGAVGNSGVVTSSSITSVGNGWYRCVVTATATATTTSYGLVISGINNTNGTTRLPTYNGSVNSDWYVGFTQCEAGAFPTSPIPTGTATATRSADTPQITGSDFLSFYNNVQGTWVAKYNFAARSTGNAVIIGCNTNGNGRFLLESPGGSGTSISAVAFNSFSTSNNKQDNAAKNGVLGSNPQSNIVDGPFPTSCSFGAQWQFYNFLNGTISNVSFYAKRLSDSMLCKLSSLTP